MTRVSFEFRDNAGNFPHDVPAGLSRVERLRYQIISESVWIAECELNEISYTGGDGVQKYGNSDYARLRGLKRELAYFTGIESEVDKPDEERSELLDALKVMVTTDHIRFYLESCDPMALKQANAAIEKAGK